MKLEKPSKKEREGVKEIIPWKCNKKVTYGMVWYDIENEQLDAGFPVLICFVLWSTLVGFIDKLPVFDMLEREPIKYDGEKYPVFALHGRNCVRDFLYVLHDIGVMTRCLKNYMMGYNNSGFDDLYLLTWLQENKVKNIPKVVGLKWLSTNLLSFKLKCRTGCTVTSKDLMKFVSGGTLMNLGETLGLPKLKDEFDVKTFTWEHAVRAIKYCARDVAITVKGWFELAAAQWTPSIGRLIRSTDNVIQYKSQAQIAYQQVIYQVRGMYTLTDKAYQYSRQAYFGAKTDSCMFGMETLKKVSVWDYTSLYPAMANSPLPIGKESYKMEKIEWEDFDPYMYRPFICTVILRKDQSTDHMSQNYGVLPVHFEKGLHFLNSGHVKGVYTCIHIKAALDDGWKVVHATDFIFQERWTTQFSDFYKEWFGVKQSYKKGTHHYWMAKQVLNSSIGYFGLKNPVNNNKALWIGIFILANTCTYHVTLKRAMEKAKIKRLLYTDTDSIFLHKSAMDRLVSMNPEMVRKTKELGNPKVLYGDLEVDGAKSMIVLAKKLYHCHEKKGHKGHHKRYGTYDIMKGALKKAFVSDKWGPDKLVRNEKIWIGKFKLKTRTMRVSINRMKKYCKICNRYVTAHFRHVK